MPFMATVTIQKREFQKVSWDSDKEKSGHHNQPKKNYQQQWNQRSPSPLTTFTV